MSFLEINNISKRFGGLLAIDDLSFSVEKGSIHGIIGPNGAGKTTLFNIASGVYQPTSGSVIFDGHHLTGLRPSKIAELGLVRTFQRAAFFQDFSVLENIMVARHLHSESSILKSIFHRRPKSEDKNLKVSRDTASFVGLGDVLNEGAGTLSHGHQQALGVAIALATEPAILMLDEPVAGMNPSETKAMANLIRRVRDEQDTTVVLVEHDMRTVMDVCDSVTVINFGQLLAVGTPDQVVSNSDVIEAYLGSDDILEDDDFAA